MSDLRDNFIGDHDERLLDRELRQVLGGDGPSADLDARFRAALAAETAGKEPGEPGVSAPGGLRPPQTPHPRRGRVAHANWKLRRSGPSPVVIGFAVAASIMLVAALMVSFSATGGVGSSRAPGWDCTSGTNIQIPVSHVDIDLLHGAINALGNNVPLSVNVDNPSNSGRVSPPANQSPSPAELAQDAWQSCRADVAPLVNAGQFELAWQNVRDFLREWEGKPRNEAVTTAAAAELDRINKLATAAAMANRPDVQANEPTNQPSDPGPMVDNAPAPANNSSSNESQPTDSQPTQPPAAQRVVLATVTHLSRNARLKMRRNANADWESFDLRGEIEAGMTLSVSGTADLLVNASALLRFDGEVTISGELEALTVQIHKDRLYLDNVGSPGRIDFSVGAVTCSLANGAVLASEQNRTSMEVHCLAGAGVTTAFGLVAGSARVRESGMTGMRVDADFYGTRFLRDLPDKVITRQDFSHADAPLSTGEIRGGSAHGIHSRGYPVRVEVVMPTTRQLTQGEVLRMRVKFSAATTLEVALWDDSQRTMKFDVQEMPAGEWRELEFPLDAAAGGFLRVLKIYAKDDTSDELAMEVDWFEIVRRPGAR